MSQRTSARIRASTEKCKEYNKERDNQDQPDEAEMSDAFRSSDDDYEESSPCSTPSSSQKISLADPNFPPKVEMQPEVTPSEIQEEAPKTPSPELPKPIPTVLEETKATPHILRISHSNKLQQVPYPPQTPRPVFVRTPTKIRTPYSPICINKQDGKTGQNSSISEEAGENGEKLNNIEVSTSSKLRNAEIGTDPNEMSVNDPHLSPQKSISSSLNNLLLPDQNCARPPDMRTLSNNLDPTFKAPLSSPPSKPVALTSEILEGKEPTLIVEKTKIADEKSSTSLTSSKDKAAVVSGDIPDKTSPAHIAAVEPYTSKPHLDSLPSDSDTKLVKNEKVTHQNDSFEQPIDFKTTTLTTKAAAVSNKCELRNDRITGLQLKHLRNTTKKAEIVDIFGLENTDYLKLLCSCKVGPENPEDVNSECFAIITAPAHVTAELVKLNAISIHEKTIAIREIELEFFEILLANDEVLTAENVLEFIFSNDNPTNQTLSHCLVLDDEMHESKSKQTRAVVVTALYTDAKVGDRINDHVTKIDSTRFYNLVCDKFNKQQQKKPSVKSRVNKSQVQKKITYPVNEIIHQDSYEQLTQEIRNYNMDICKQMRKKLNYFQRENFVIKFNKGSTSREQIYIECSTAMYECMRYFLIPTLKEKMKCTEDLKKRKIASDLDEKSEVESQYSIQFPYNNTKYNVHVTFFYTKCSIFLQGSSVKLNNITPAQFLAIHYIEKVANAVINTAPLEEISKSLEERTLSFLKADEVDNIKNNIPSLESGKCVSCSRRCSNNNKSVLCSKCNRRQHFNCAGIKNESERDLFLSGSELFVCNKCFADVGVSLDESRSSADDMAVQNIIPGNVDQHKSTTSNKTVDNSITANTNFIEFAEADLKDHQNDTNKPCQQNLINPNCQIQDKIMIRRLQDEIMRLNINHEDRIKKLSDENNNLKESLRRCIADLEKEKETKDTLQHCVNALKLAPKAASNRHLSNASSQESGSGGVDQIRTTQRKCKFQNSPSGCTKGDQCSFLHDPSPEEDQQGQEGQFQQSNKPPCRFFNRKSGCAKGVSCRFPHIKNAPCQFKQRCRKRSCKLYHGQSDGNVNFSQAPSYSRPPDRNATNHQSHASQSKSTPVPLMDIQISNPYQAKDRPAPYNSNQDLNITKSFQPSPAVRSQHKYQSFDPPLHQAQKNLQHQQQIQYPHQEQQQFQIADQQHVQQLSLQQGPQQIPQNYQYQQQNRQMEEKQTCPQNPQIQSQYPISNNWIQSPNSPPQLYSNVTQIPAYNMMMSPFPTYQHPPVPLVRVVA